MLAWEGSLADYTFAIGETEADYIHQGHKSAGSFLPVFWL